MLRTLSVCFGFLIGLSVVFSSSAESNTPDSRQILNAINANLNAIGTMQGDFIQFGPQGERAQGRFFLSRPGKVRFKYAPPARIDIVSDGKSVAVIDRRMETQELYPLSQTPLRFLLSEQINLLRDVDVNQIVIQNNLIQVAVMQESAFGSSRLTLFFDMEDHSLKQWTVTDPQGLDTSVSIYNVVMDKQMSKRLFKIDRQFNRQSFER